MPSAMNLNRLRRDRLQMPDLSDLLVGATPPLEEDDSDTPNKLRADILASAQPVVHNDPAPDGTAVGPKKEPVTDSGNSNLRRDMIQDGTIPRSPSTDELRQPASMMGGKTSLPEPSMMAAKPQGPTRLDDLQYQLDQSNKRPSLWKQILLGMGAAVPGVGSYIAGRAEGQMDKRSQLGADIDKERALQAREQEQDKSLQERQLEFQTTQETNRPWRESQIALNQEKIEADKANKNQAAPTVTTDSGVMQWDPATHAYSIRVGGAKPKGLAEPMFDHEGMFLGVKDPTDGSLAVPGTPQWLAHPEFQQIAQAAAAAHQKGVRESIQTAGAKSGAEAGARTRAEVQANGGVSPREQGRSDRSFQFSSTQLEKVAQPIDAAVQRVGRLNDTLTQGSPQADALAAPELLSVMAGGQGSGLRMNEAEISRIVGGRSKWESLQAAANQWRLDPSKANSITPDQRQQIRALVDAVNTKLTAKQRIIDDARQQLINSEDPGQHRQIVAGARSKMTDIDTGGGTSGTPGPSSGGDFFSKFGGKARQ